MLTGAAAVTGVTGRPARDAVRTFAIVLVIGIASMALLSHGEFVAFRRVPHPIDAVGAAMVALSALPLLAWRRSPMGVVALTSAASVAAAASGRASGLALGPAAALYLAAASRDEAAPWSARWTAAAIGFFAAYVAASATGGAAMAANAFLHTGLAWSAAWFAGDRARLRWAQIAELRREAERERLLAAAEERARIARDLHDAAGHAINVIAVQAGAARLRHDQDPDRSLTALGSIEELARCTAADIDRFVGGLRAGSRSDGSVDPPPGLAAVDALIAHHSDTGLDVTMQTRGPRRVLGAAADQAVYRILQEALTNAARHGSGSACVELAFDGGSVVLTVSNPSRPAPAPALRGGGHGIVGMRERAASLGGQLDVRSSEGAYEVRALIPDGSAPS